MTASQVAVVPKWYRRVLLRMSTSAGCRARLPNASARNTGYYILDYTWVITFRVGPLGSATPIPYDRRYSIGDTSHQASRSVVAKVFLSDNARVSTQAVVSEQRTRDARVLAVPH